jgi:two-component system osmolarity sensor histidine kinase EnvZ
LVRDTASGVARTKPGGPARLTVEAPQTASLSVKPAALKRCLTNVIDNAFKHGRQVAVTLTCDARWAQIAVEDDGPGIPEARREEAFRPFHRLDEGRNLQKGGSGLGLAIARDIARAHGGDITLDHSSAGGVKAMIRLPV